MNKKIAVLGAGSWGTALALQLAKNGNDVFLWGHRPQLIDDITKAKENKRYLPGYSLPNNLVAIADLKKAVVSAELVLLSVPSHAFPEMLRQIKDDIGDRPIMWAIKGFEKSSGELLSTLFENIIGTEHPYALLAGPSFAKEVAAGKPTAVVIVNKAKFDSVSFALPFNSKTFACYMSNDVIGAQIGGAVKNVIAIAAGIADGLNYGANTRAALITRGLHEMLKLSTAMGGQAATLSGLSGLGDLVLTATDNLSRNRRFGLGIGEGRSIADIKAEIGQVIEGENAAYDTWQLAQRYNVRMPITECIYRVLHEGLPIDTAINNLMDRSLKEETN